MSYQRHNNDLSNESKNFKLFMLSTLILYTFRSKVLFRLFFTQL